MAKLGVITDGISRDFEHALRVLSQGRDEIALGVALEGVDAAVGFLTESPRNRP